MTIKVSQVLGAPEGSPAEFENMPTVGGDPIVESGSNSDGNWTRWADGTQQCRLNDGVVGTTTGSNPKTWVYPNMFFVIPSLSGSSLWSDTTARIVFFRNPTNELTEYEARTVSDVALSGSVSSLTATGRWK